MDDVKNFPDAVSSLKSDHSAKAFIKLSTALDDPFDSYRHPDSRALDTYHATKPCYLFAIPRELRDMISDYAISFGGVQILQTSKKLREEGTHYLYKRRVYQLDIDLTKSVPKFSLQKPIAALIQNVNIDMSIDVNVEPLGWIHEIEPMAMFAGADIPRQTCQVMVHFRRYCHSNFDSIVSRRTYTLERILSYIRTLVGFSHLILQFTYSTAMTRFEGAVRSALKAFVIDYQRYLDSDLGSGTWNDANDSCRQYLDFHPRGYWEANPAPLSDGTQRLID